MGRKKHKKNKEPEQRCLCARCATDYEIAGFDLKRDYGIENKQRCDICNFRYGYVYIISKE